MLVQVLILPIVGLLCNHQIHGAGLLLLPLFVLESFLASLTVLSDMPLFLAVVASRSLARGAGKASETVLHSIVKIMSEFLILFGKFFVYPILDSQWFEHDLDDRWDRQLRKLGRSCI
jgi:hypothetical protein